MSFKIAKSTGRHEPFNIKKIKRSLQKAGASQELALEIIEKIKKIPKIKSTKDVHKFILQYLHDKNRPLAARYNLKYALMEMGPAGYSFEIFAAEIYKHLGYSVTVGTIVEGFCVNHEVDLIATNKKEKIIAECKFHNRRGLKTDIKAVLYIKSRFDDIKNKSPQHTKKNLRGLIITNTKFTSEAIKYGECAHLSLIDWSYPHGESLADIINKLGLHPITTLTSLNKKQKETFIKNGFVLCKQAQDNTKLLQNLGLTKHQISKIISESQAICKLSVT